jgi:hypothetical protein
MELGGIFGLQKEAVLAIATGVFTAVAVGMFVRSVITGGSRPYLWAWVLRAGICAVAFVTQMLEGATYSLALAGAQVLGVVFIIACILAFQPRRGRLDRNDWVALGIAGFGVVLWVTSGEPVYGLLGTLLADTSATGMGIRAAVRKGTRESVPFWTCSFVAAAMAVLAAGNSAGWVILAAPLFSCLNAAVNILTVSYVRRRKRTKIPIMEPLIIKPDLA